MKGILVYSEALETALGLLTKARELAAASNAPVSLALLSNNGSDQLEQYFAHGAKTIYRGAADALSHFDSRTLAQALHQLVEVSQVDVILLGSTQQGRELAARLAQRLSAGCLTDALSITLEEDSLLVERRSWGGNTVSTKMITTEIQVIAVMPSAYEPDSLDSSGGDVIDVPLDLSPPRTRQLDKKSKDTGSGNIENAEVVVCIGRGFAKADDLSLAQSLAVTLGGMVACTRPISHENHWLTEDQMIGISGKVLSPRLYLGVGVSGQIQHTVGILDAKAIVAINKDPNAPIFKISDYGIVGDLYDIVPKLIESIQSSQA